MKRCLILLLLVCCGCGAPDPSPAPPSSATPPSGVSIVDAEAPKAAATPATQPAETAPPMVVAYLTVTNLQGEPLPGIMPIVTAQPNAFDKPVAVGQPTGPDGKSSVRFLSDRTLYVRAWDPNLHWFPNNFLEIPAKSGNVARDLTVAMVQAARLRGNFYLPGGTPAANVRIEMMMSHPQWGPWWPGACVTGAQGDGEFASVPPGKYDLRFDAGTSGAASRAGLTLMPGEALELGDVALF